MLCKVFLQDLIERGHNPHKDWFLQCYQQNTKPTFAHVLIGSSALLPANHSQLTASQHAWIRAGRAQTRLVVHSQQYLNQMKIRPSKDRESGETVKRMLTEEKRTWVGLHRGGSYRQRRCTFSVLLTVPFGEALGADSALSAQQSFGYIALPVG